MHWSPALKSLMEAAALQRSKVWGLESILSLLLQVTANEFIGVMKMSLSKGSSKPLQWFSGGLFGPL